jgi:hypothetical protein
MLNLKWRLRLLLSKLSLLRVRCLSRQRVRLRARVAKWFALRQQKSRLLARCLPRKPNRERERRDRFFQ